MSDARVLARIVVLALVFVLSLSMLSKRAVCCRLVLSEIPNWKRKHFLHRLNFEYVVPFLRVHHCVPGGGGSHCHPPSAIRRLNEMDEGLEMMTPKSKCHRALYFSFRVSGFDGIFFYENRSKKPEEVWQRTE